MFPFFNFFFSQNVVPSHLVWRARFCEKTCNSAGLNSCVMAQGHQVLRFRCLSLLCTSLTNYPQYYTVILIEHASFPSWGSACVLPLPYTSYPYSEGACPRFNSPGVCRPLEHWVAQFYSAVVEQIDRFLPSVKTATEGEDWWHFLVMGDC